MKLIPKDALVAEIERRIKHYNLAAKEFGDEGYKDNVLMEQCKANACERILSFLDTLEVKEVDLDGERRKYLTEHFNVYEDGVLQSKRSNLPLDTLDVIKIASYFFELGIQVNNKPQKGEEV